MYTNALTHGLAEVSGDRLIRNFLLGIYVKDPAYSTSQQNFQALSPRTMDQIVENYRQHLRLHSAARIGGDHSAFAANQGSQGTSNSTYRGNQIPTPKCTKLPETRQKVDEALRNPAIKDKHLYHLDHCLQYLYYIIYLRQSFLNSIKVQATKSLSIRDVLILGSGADTHICNSSMVHCYTKQRIAHPDDRVEAGAEKLPLGSYGLLQIPFDTPHGPETITPSNAPYVPSFLTNVGALDLFTAKVVVKG
ncbi:hypothetical protein MMC22_001444 [Lobaria immixta]|nr:hypothetical protein [Lobaria immixta]